MISAYVAYVIARHSEFTNHKGDIKAQERIISRIIGEAASRGFFTAYYKGELYPEVANTLIEKGFKVNKIIDTINDGEIKIYKGVNITWYNKGRRNGLEKYND